MDDYMVTMDYHDKIVYKGAERILVYNVKKHSNFEDQADLVLDFELKFPEANNPKKTRKDSLPTRVMPARMSKFNRLFSLCDVSVRATERRMPLLKLLKTNFCFFRSKLLL